MKVNSQADNGLLDQSKQVKCQYMINPEYSNTWNHRSLKMVFDGHRRLSCEGWKSKMKFEVEIQLKHVITILASSALG